MRASLHYRSLLVAGALVIASCGGNDTTGGPTTAPPTGTPPAPTLDGTSWMVTGGAVDGASLVPLPGRLASFDVKEGRASGSTGCNTYDGALSLGADGVLSINRLAVTEIGCEPQAMAYEQRLLAALGRVDRIALDADRLLLASGDESVTIELAAAVPPSDVRLDAGSWMLTSLTTGGAVTSVVAATQPFLVFDRAAGAIRGNGGCNDFGAQVAIDGDNLVVTDLVHTEMACDVGIMRMEAGYFRILATATTWHIDGSTLVIGNAEDERLGFAFIDDRAEQVVLGWLSALADGDLDAAGAAMAAPSLEYVEQRGGLAAFMPELTEGWGSWAAAADRRVWQVSGTFGDGSTASAVVLVGTVSIEGMVEDRAAALVVVEEGGRLLVHPFTETAPIGFVVPRAEFLDVVAPDVPFEFAVPAGFEALAFLDGSEPLTLQVARSAAGDQRITATAQPLPQLGDHTFSVLFRTADGSVGVQTVLFTIVE